VNGRTIKVLVRGGKQLSSQGGKKKLENRRSPEKEHEHSFEKENAIRAQK